MRASNCLASLSLVLTLGLLPASAVAEPMECTPDILRMALSAGGTMPSELVGACAAIPKGDELYGLAQYMIAVHYERRRDLPRAALALGRAASQPPFATDTRVLYRLSRLLIGAGDLEGALVAKDRFLLNSGPLSREKRTTLLANLNRLLSRAFEVAAAGAAEEGDERRYQQALIAALFYREAARHLSGQPAAGEAVSFRPEASPEALASLPPPR